MDDYSANIDWDKIYATFHEPEGIAGRISLALEDSVTPLIFCGFPEVAAHLAAESPLQFVDYSPVITARTRARYPSIPRIVTGEISEVLQTDPTETIVIACRLSAFWQSQGVFAQLAAALLAFPRKVVLIDFFDRDAVYAGKRIYYASGTDRGRWAFKSFDDLPGCKPPLQVANLNICYTVGTTDVAYEARRAFFKKAAIGSWCKATFVDYATTISGPLLQNDPSFLVKLTHR